MISLYDRAIELLHDLNALLRIRVVADDVAEADEMSALALVRIGQHGFGCFEIGVQVAKDGKAHGQMRRITVMNPGSADRPGCPI